MPRKYVSKRRPKDFNIKAGMDSLNCSEIMIPKEATYIVITKLILRL